ncbi:MULTISPECIES: DUF6266 family protein [Butyricimonas]|uniref:DUF6266 family protein n=1 Tax=Butyricimonas TaxID=574697 RepID=UPI0007FB3048|nr:MULTISPECIES: DUF6266 family protein [Butyricimonas]
MAIFDPFIFKNLRKSLGNITLCKYNDVNVMKTKITQRHDPGTPAVLAQRARMREAGKLSQIFAPALQKGFVKHRLKNRFNAFTSENMAALEVDEAYQVTIHHEQLKCSAGILVTPKVQATLNTESGKIIFEQQEQTQGAFCLPTDTVFAVVYEPLCRTVEIVSLRDRGESGSTSFTLPGDWDAEKVHIYCFATNKNGSIASNTLYLPLNPSL